MEQMIKNILDHMEESVNDAGCIASSAIALTVDRSNDLNLNPVISLMMLKFLVEKNLELMNSITRKHMTKYSPGEHDQYMREMEKMIREACEGKTKQITLPG